MYVSTIGMLAMVALGIGGIVASIIFFKPLWLKIFVAVMWGIICTSLALLFTTCP